MTDVREDVRKGIFVPTVMVLLAVALMAGLGYWQLQRKVWKENLIAAMHERLAAPPVDLPPAEQWASLTPENAEFRRVKIHAEFVPAQDTYVYVAGSALRDDIKEPGYFVFRPAKLPDGHVVAVNRGYVPLEYATQSPDGTQEVVGYLRFPERASWFMTEVNKSGDTWFVRNPTRMAAVRGWGEVAPFYIDQESPVPASGLPRPASLVVRLRDDHLGYALTWFALAAVFLAVYASWLVRRNREPATP